MSDLPRLLLCSFDVLPGPTGQSRRLTEYLRGLSEHFHVVALTLKTPDHPHIEKFHGGRLLRVPVGAGDLTARVEAFDRAVRRQLDSEEYAVVHFTDPFGGYALCEERESYGYKIVYDAQSFPSQELRFTHPQLEGDRRFLARVRRQELYCLMNADRVLTGSNVTHGFIQSLGVSGDAVEVLRQPVDLAPFVSMPSPPPTSHPMRLLYLGSQVAWQGLPTLLRGMAHARKKVDLQLAVVGPSHSAWQPLLEDLVRDLELGGQVSFQPPVVHADVHKVLGASDVGVIPLDELERNHLQGGPLSKAAEYLAAGRPLVASDLPLTRELLPADATRFHAPGDPEDLADCLVELAEDPALRARLGAAALAHRHLHDAGALRARLHQIYRELAGLSASSRPDTAQAAEGVPTAGTPTGKLPGLADGGGTDPELSQESLEARTARQKLSVRPSRAAPGRPELSQMPPTDPAIPHADGPKVVMGTLLPDAEEPSFEVAAPPLPPPLEPEEISADEVEEAPAFSASTARADDDLNDLEEVSQEDIYSVVTLAPIPPPLPERIESADDAVMEPLGDQPYDEAVASRLDPWLAQLIHGWCPPEGAQFARPTPPTNFPGRDGPPPATVASLPRPSDDG